VNSLQGPVLVIAGAGSGKTRTIVYRLARLVREGISPEAILLLTFTRRASQEMLNRAGRLLGMRLSSVAGGTFHSFAYSILRRTPPPGYGQGFTVMDQPDAQALLKEARDDLKIGKGDRSFPKTRTVLDLLGKARNKECEITDILSREAFHLLAYADDFIRLEKAYAQAKIRNGLMDYDDLLFSLERLLTEDESARAMARARFSHVMVDEYQDTNLVQDRLVRLIGGRGGNVMAVGDDAQSIYAFRGADIQNILDFPKNHPGTKVIKLERNYRSTQPILSLTNEILAGARARYEKHLYTERRDGAQPRIIRPLSDLSQAKLVTDKVVELLKTRRPHEVAVLFRAGYQSYHLEVQLNRLGIKFRKYGGLKYTEAAHIKDMLAYVRLAHNPADTLAWDRCAAHIKGIGPKTSRKIRQAVLSGDPAQKEIQFKRWPEIRDLCAFLDRGSENKSPRSFLEEVLEFYRPILEKSYPDDYPRREPGLEELIQIAAGYSDLDLFLTDLSLENPDPSGGRDQSRDEESITLSTIHSAKGLEWSAVILIDLVEDRFPSKRAMIKEEDFEEERRLMYVACTRAKDSLFLFSPKSICQRGGDGSQNAFPSPFISDIPPDLFEDLSESFSGGLSHGPKQAEQSSPASKPKSAPPSPARLGRCRHKIFGPGKIVQAIGPDKFRVNFEGFGLKVILADYLELEDES